MTRQEMEQLATETLALTRKGEQAVIDAKRKATEGMAKLMDNIGTPEAKAEMLMHHGVLLGAGAQFGHNVFEQYEAMKKDLLELTGKDETFVSMLMDLWMAKVLRETIKTLRDEV